MEIFGYDGQTSPPKGNLQPLTTVEVIKDYGSPDRSHVGEAHHQLQNATSPRVGLLIIPPVRARRWIEALLAPGTLGSDAAAIGAAVLVPRQASELLFFARDTSPAQPHAHVAE